MARSKTKPTKDSKHNRTSGTNTNKAAYKANAARFSVPSSSNNPSNSSQNLSRLSEDSTVATATGNNNATRPRTPKKSSKRKSLLPNKRLTFTEEFKTSSKRYTIQRYGKEEVCGRRTYFDLRFYMKTTFLLIPRLPFSRLVREIIGIHGDFRITATALEALQEAAEIYLVTLFAAANLSAAHANRKTIKTRDMALALFLRKMI